MKTQLRRRWKGITSISGLVGFGWNKPYSYKCHDIIDSCCHIEVDIFLDASRLVL
jgi:hypothetical protein